MEIDNGISTSTVISSVVFVLLVPVLICTTITVAQCTVLDEMALAWSTEKRLKYGSIRLNLSAGLSVRIYSIFLSRQNSFS